MTSRASTRAARTRLLRVLAAGVGSALVLAGVSGSLRPLSAAAASTINVTTNTDEVDGTDGVISLREAIATANTAGGTVTIDVPAGTYTLATGDLRVGLSANANVSIIGQGATPADTVIKGDGTDRVFSLDPNLVGHVTVAISNVTISGGHDPDGLGGAGIIGGNAVTADTTTLSNCVVTGNNTTTSTATNSPGGGIQYIGGSLSIDSCTISNNSSGSSPGGGVDYETLTPNPGTFSLTSSTVSGNTLTNTDPTAFVGGAGVHVQAMAGSTVTLNGDTFTANVATGSSTGPVGGGGLWLEGDPAVAATVTASTFTGNQSNGHADTLAGGGAISLASGTTHLSFSRIVGNTATNGPGGVLNNGAGAVTTATDNWWGCNAGPGNTGCDAAVNSGSGTGSLTVNPRLVLTTTAASTKLLAGQTSAVTASLTHDSTSADTSGSGHVPDGIAVSWSNVLGGVSPGAGTLSGGTAGTVYTAGVTTGAGSASATVDNQKITAAIGIGVAPLITSANTTTFTADVANSFPVTATGTPASTYSESGSLPGGVSLNSTTGVLAGTPVHGSQADYPITLKASNGFGTDDTQSFTLTVKPLTQAPAITSANSTGFTEAQAGTFTVTASGIPAATLSETSGTTLPPGVTFTAATGVLAGTPAPGSHGTYLLNFAAANGVTPDASQPFTLTVGLPPAFTSANAATLTAGSPGTFDVTASGYPAPSITTVGPLPTGIIFDPITHVLGGTAAALTGGTYGFDLVASDGFGTNATQHFTLTVNEAPVVTSSNGTTFTVGAAGSFGMTATGFPTPALGASGDIPSGVTFGGGVLSGTPAALTGGTHAIDLTASNGVGGVVTQHFTLTVDEAVAITSDSTTTLTAGTAGTFTVQATGFPAATFTELGSLPTGVTLTSGGVLSGTPGAHTGGTYDLTLTAHNGIGVDATQAFVLIVDEAPQITSDGSATFTVGAHGTFTVTTTGTPSPTLGVTGTLPDGVSFTGGVLSGTPLAHAGSTYPLTFTAHNGVGVDATQDFVLTVNEAPAITSDSSTTFVVGTSGSFTVKDGGFPTPTLTIGGDTLPGGITFYPTTGALGGTPDAGTAKVYHLTFTAHNGTNPDATQSFTLTVDQKPAITGEAATTFTVGSSAITYTVTATGFPDPVLSVGPLPNGLSFDAGTGVLSGTPAVGTGGAYPLTFTASNGVQPDATLQVTLSIDEAPQFTSPDAVTFTTGVAGAQTVHASGYPAPTLTLTSGTPPSGVTFDATSGHLSGTPTAGTGATYTLTFTASNLIGFDATQTFTLTVDQAPAFTSADNTAFTAGSPGTFTVKASGFPAPTLSENPSDPLPSGVTFDAASGLLSGSPAAGTGGPYTLNFTAHNVTKPDATQTFTLTVDEAPVITSPAATTFTTGVAGSFSVTATGFPVPTLGATPLPLGVGFDPATGLLSGTPAAGTAGDHSITITAHNGIAPDASQIFTLTVKNATTTSVTSSKLHSVVNQPVTFTATVAGAGTPTGKVLFMDGSATLGGGTLTPAGVATFTTSTLTATSHTITAVYTGDATNSTSTSPALTQVVTTVGAVTVTPHSHTLRANGTSHTSVAAVVTDAGGQPVAGDTVSFSNLPGGGLSLSPATATTDANGVATTTATAGTTAGSVTITATEGFGNVPGTATEKLLGVKFKAKALTATRIPADGSSTTVATVLVVDGSGAPVSGEPVTFQTEGHSGDASLAQPSVLTDSSGVASDTVTSSTTAGTQAITVSDTIGDPAGDFATVLALTQLPAAGPTNSSFIHNAYVTLLGRDADPAGYAFWLNLLDHGTPRTALASALASSPEYRSHVIGGTSTVPGLYQQYLGRPADPGGVVFWLGLMATGYSFEQVRLGLLGSPEYPLHHGNDPSAVIDALYEDVLGRPSDPTGKAYWLANYSATTIATQFIHSPEGRAHLVSVLYGSILNRTPDSIGLSHWTQQLLSGGTDEYIIGALLGSDEYFLTH